jgi:hypothetical protein
MLIALSVPAAAGVASADDPKAAGAPTEQKADDPQHQQHEQQPQKQKQKPQKQKQAMPSKDAGQPGRTSAEVMKITEQAMAHITAAQVALAKGDKAAANKALTQSARSLGKLYDAPELAAILNQLDEAIASAEGEGKAKGGKQPAAQGLDLAPLSATIRHHQVYVDPAVVAGIDEAAAKAKQGDPQAAADALRLARNRIAIDVAFLPVENAYLRVLAAQQAIDQGNMKQAQRFLQEVPIVVAELQLSTPLVPVRFKLNAAALAAEEGNWERSEALIREATDDLQAIERMSKGTPSAQEVSAFVDDVEQLGRQMDSQPRPQPQQIRELAKRSQNLGA